MRKTISLTHPRHKPAQALDLVKSTLRKYVKRERRKELPEDTDYWDFDCRMGLTEDVAESVHIKEINKRLDAFAATGAEAVYVEILARPAIRTRRAEDV